MMEKNFAYETPIRFEIPETTTIDIMGNKEVIIDTKGNEKKKSETLNKAYEKEKII